MGCDSTTSSANSVWLETTISELIALALAFAAKHFAPKLQISAPTHSLPLTELAAQTLRSTSGASSRSPVTPGVSAQLLSRCASLPNDEISKTNSPSGSGSSEFNFCKQT